MPRPRRFFPPEYKAEVVELPRGGRPGHNEWPGRPQPLVVVVASTDRRTSRLFVAAVPVGYWAPFWVAPLVQGTGVDDPPHPIPRIAGVPTSLLGAAATTLTAVAGWLLDRRAG